MLSLPPIVPRDHLLYNNTHRSTPFQFDASSPSTNPQQQGNLNARHVGHAQQQSSLAQLRADENIIEQRKHNVRRFGAGWLRPPGVSKTLQSKIEEQHEQLEQMELQRRDAQLRAEEEAAQQAGMQGLDGQDMAGGEERNLDDDVPEADEIVLASEDGEDEAEEDAEPFTSSPGGSHLNYSLDQEQAELEREEAELDGRLQDERDLGMDRDLDDVPEAGSYEHTDTEEEDVSTDEDDDDAPPVLRMHSALQSNGRNRTSLASEDLEASSFLESSPAMARRSRDSGPRNSLLRRRRHS